MNSSRAAHGFQPTRAVASPGMSPDIGLTELAQLLNVSKAGATKYARRDDFPKPRELARGRVWDSDEVLAWAKKTLPLKQGRPPKS
jgi:predicted DNA-binding transcriptional regulator AlpA